MSQVITARGARMLGPDFDATGTGTGTDNLTRGLARMYRRGLRRTPGMIYRLRRSTRTYRQAILDHDVLLSPVLSHTTPRIGRLAATLDFDELFARLRTYVAFTPLNNAAGSPAISLPLGRTAAGLPIGVHVSADLGDERTLLELAYELEAAQPWARIQDRAPAAQPAG